MKKLNYFSAIRFLSKYIRRHKKNFTMFYFGWLFDMMLGVVMPILFGVMIDEIVYRRDLQTFLRISLVFVAMSVFSCILYFLIYAQHQYLMSMYVYDIQRDLFRHLQKCSAEFMSDSRSGDIVSIIQSYAQECMHFVIRNIIHLVNGVLKLVLLTVYIFIINPWIGLFTLAAVPVSILTNAHFGKKIRGCSNEQRTCYGDYVSCLYEIFTGIRDIRLLGMFRKVNRNVVGCHKRMFGINIRSGVSTITAQNIMQFTNLVIQLAIFTLTAYLVSCGSMTIGLLTVVMTYFTALTGQATVTSSSYLDAQNRVGYIQRISDFMDSETEESWHGKDALKVRKGEITVKDITFAYQEGGRVLDRFSLHIRPGERIAICGRSGCGKTTFGYMMLGFYRAQCGSISIDGQRLTDCTLKSIRRNIGMISQDVLLFDGSIKENLLLGKQSASEEEIVSALQKAGIWEYVSGLPDGIGTVVGSRGICLSGGQKQRIAIARIYLRNPPIIIFDEATSALDDETERQIHEAWKTMLTGRTSIIIAHRQSAVMLCDRAAVMENGKIVEAGTPEALAKSGTSFRKLFALQG